MTITPTTMFMTRRLSRSLRRLPTATTASDPELRVNVVPKLIHSAISSFECRKNSAHFQYQSTNCFSSDATNKQQDTTTTNAQMTRAKKIKSLKNVIKPFFLKCHPDVQTTAMAKRVNLTAMQNLNGYLDLIEATVLDTHKRVEWPATIMVEFLITTEATGPTTAMSAKKKNTQPASTRKRVELVVPPPKLREAISSAGGGGFSRSERNRAIDILLQRANRELNKVLTVAGLNAPAYYEITGEDNDNEEDDGQRVKRIDDFWDDEFDFLEKNRIKSPKDDGYGSASTMRFRNDMEKPRFDNAYERSRERFTRNLDSKRIQKIYDEAIHDMKADIATEGHIRNHTKRRQNVINDVLGKVRIDSNAVDDIDLTEQLIALRRLSLILDDNFDTFQMEDMGRMWENMVIVLVPERTFSTSSSALFRRRKRQKETGFRFTYSADEIVIVHVPIDFGDEEIIEEFKRNLNDFNKLVGNGMEDLYPSWLKDYAHGF